MRRFQHLFTTDNPGAAEDLIAALNPESLEVLSGAFVEPSLTETAFATLFSLSVSAIFALTQMAVRTSPCSIRSCPSKTHGKRYRNPANEICGSCRGCEASVDRPIAVIPRVTAFGPVGQSPGGMRVFSTSTVIRWLVFWPSRAAMT